MMNSLFFPRPLFLLPLFLIPCLFSNAQAPGHFCQSDDLHESYLQLFPEAKALEEMAEKELYHELKQGEKKSRQPFTLPVVVHIIHDDGAENIPDAMVLQGIQHLNEAFANMNAYDDGTGANTQIDFCLATRDPDGGPTTGINRVKSPLTQLDYTMQDLALKNLIRWDPFH